MLLNLHERWLLMTVGVRRAERMQLLRAVDDCGIGDGELDLLAETGEYTLAKRSIRRDLPALLDQLLSPYELRAGSVAYGNRRYRSRIILVAALHQAGISPDRFRTDYAAGARTVQQFTTM